MAVVKATGCWTTKSSAKCKDSFLLCGRDLRRGRYVVGSFAFALIFLVLPILLVWRSPPPHRNIIILKCLSMLNIIHRAFFRGVHGEVFFGFVEGATFQLDFSIFWVFVDNRTFSLVCCRRHVEAWLCFLPPSRELF